MCVRLPPFRPKKSLGQNFLRDDNIARKIVSAIDPRPDQVVVEVGPGDGALTRYLAPRVRTLVVVDIDVRVIERVRAMQFEGAVEIVHEDFLQLDLGALAQRFGQVRVVGNIPYHITSPILFHVLDQRAAVTDAVFLIQREVARRLVAAPATKDFGILAVFHQLWAEPSILFDVSPNVFFPRPSVTSSLLSLRFRAAPAVPVDNEEFFRTMVRSVFSKRRKTLRNSLRYFLGSEAVLPQGIDLQRRPEDLSVSEFVLLGNTLWRRVTKVNPEGSVS